jgi:sulfopyruvate decarboxylase subunit beta
MKRIDAIQAIYPAIADHVVVTIMGATAAELFACGHRPNFFYLEHAMGLASSMGLGIALARPDLKVIVLDGDGSVLMNLGGLSTMARSGPPNLVQIVFDNEVLLSVGVSFTTATADVANIEGIARESGVPRTATCKRVEELRECVDMALASNELTTIVAKVEPVGPKSFFIDPHMLENRFEFERALRRMGDSKPIGDVNE